MNVFYLNFSDALANVPLYLDKRLPDGNVHLLSNSKDDITVVCKNHLNYRDCSLGHFIDSDKYSDIPVDASLLTDMSECESIALKMMDRYQFTEGLLVYEHRINLYHKQLKYWYNYLLTEKIDVCVFAVIPHVVSDFIIYCLSKYLGLKTLMLYRIPVLPGKNVSLYVLYDIHEHIPELRFSYKHYLNNSAGFSLSKRMQAYLELQEGSKNKTFTGIVSRSRSKKKYFDPKRYINFIQYYANWLHSWVKLWGTPIDIMYRLVYKLNVDFSEKPIYQSDPDLTRQYIFVSLHYQPECTTSPMGWWFVHQDLMVDILVKSVPENIRILIKAHPRGGMSKMLYKRIQADSRTFFVKPEINSFDLIANSTAVATITGTAGWEAFLNKKPVLMFGDYFYQDAPGVYKVKSVDESVKAITEILSDGNNVTDHMVMAFLKAVEEKTFPGWVDNRYASASGLTSDENCRNIADSIAAAIVN